MSVIVKGMEMPTTCMTCHFLRFYNVYCCGITLKRIDNGKCREDCPLVPVPPHGRLVDESWLKKAMITTLEVLKKNPKMDGQEMHLIAAFDTLRAMVEDAPTVIEAEEGD